jgi:hypothetical protein
VTRQLRQSLEERLRTVPDLLARAVGRRYTLPVSSMPIKKLRKTIQRRDAIIHPRWNRYVHNVGLHEAAEAVDAVELYLQSVQMKLHPYLAGYFVMLGTIPPGWHKHDGTDVGYRTRAKRQRPLGFSRMRNVGVPQVIVSEWVGAYTITKFALESGVEGDSEGSLLSRAALILIYAMLDAELAIVAQWHMAEHPEVFDETETNFLNEVAIGIGHDGEVTVQEDRQSFKKRVIAIPRVLARKIEGREISVPLGKRWGEQLLKGHELRNKLVHVPIGKSIPRVSLSELLAAANAVRSYFTELSSLAPKTFIMHSLILKSFDLPLENDISRYLEEVRRFREKTGSDEPIAFPFPAR